MAIISHKHKLLFIMTPRTASTAVAELLQQELNGEYIPEADILNENGSFKVQKKHSTLTDLIDNQLLTEKDSQSLIKFTTVRNPFDSLVSLYQKRRDNYQPLLDDPQSWIYRVPNYVEDMLYCQTHSFNDWIRKHYLRSSTKRLLGGTPSMYRHFTKGMDVVLRFEKIKEDFQKFLQNENIPMDSSIPFINATEGRQSGYRKYYSNFSRRVVEFALKDDLNRYGYDF